MMDSVLFGCLNQVSTELLLLLILPPSPVPLLKSQSAPDFVLDVLHILSPLIQLYDLLF